MKLGSAPARMIALLLAGLAVCGVAPAAAGRWVSLVDKPYGIRVVVPRSWYAVPPTVAAVETLVARLDETKQVGLAGVYSGFVSSEAARAQMLRYIFQVFEYAPTATVQPDFALAVARTTKAIAGNPAAISASFAKRYALEAGTAITTRSVVQLPCGPAAFIAGTQPAQGGIGALGARTQFQVYVIPHGTLLFDLSFRADAGSLSDATTFSEIARRFAFV